jgi:hypothetical protein
VDNFGIGAREPQIWAFLSGTRFHDSTAPGGVAVVFERDEGELDLVRGNEVFAEDGDTLERGKLADSDNAGRPEAEAGVFAAHVPPLVEDGPHARGRVRRGTRAAPAGESHLHVEALAAAGGLPPKIQSVEPRRSMPLAGLFVAWPRKPRPNPIAAFEYLLAAAIGQRGVAEGSRLSNYGGDERESGPHRRPALGPQSGERRVGQEEPDHERAVSPPERAAQLGPELPHLALQTPHPLAQPPGIVCSSTAATSRPVASPFSGHSTPEVRVARRPDGTVSRSRLMPRVLAVAPIPR